MLVCLCVLDRKSGRILWSVQANSEFRHNAICIGGGRLYVIDRESSLQMKTKTKAKDSDKMGPPPPARLIAFDLNTGRIVWSKKRDDFRPLLQADEGQSNSALSPLTSFAD